MTLQDWVLLVGILTPLAGLSGSAITYVALESQKRRDSRYNRFWEVMKQAGVQDGNTAAKLAAFYELRRYPEYADVIIRMCEQVGTGGAEGSVLKQEMMLTAEFLRAKTIAKTSERPK